MFSPLSRSARRPPSRGALALSLLAGATGARYPFNDRVRVEAAVGHSWLARSYADSYTHGLVSAVFALPSGRQGGPGLELRLTAHDTDRAAERLFPDMAGARFEAALQATF